jgi:hypothetical protein
LSVVGCQWSVFSFKLAVGSWLGSSLIAHRSPCSLLPAPIAALFERSAAIEPEPKILAMTKNPIKQAPNASKLLAGKVQLQR